MLKVSYINCAIIADIDERNTEMKSGKTNTKTKTYNQKSFQKWLDKPLEEQRVECPCREF
jgi:hypothetical protein